MNLKAVTFLVLVFLGVNEVSAAPATEKSIRELMAVTGAEDLSAQVLQGVLPALKSAIPNAPDSFWNDFMKDVQPDELVSLIVPIYQRNLTEEDIQSALVFYRSPAGRRLIAKQSVIGQQSMQAGQQWGRILAQRALARFQAVKSKTP